MPWCVVLCKNIDQCHPQVLQVLAQALADGFITDGCGKRIYLSDTVVILTADITLAVQRRLGFRQAEESSPATARRAAEQALGMELVAQIDLVCSQVAGSTAACRHWLRDHLLCVLTERFSQRGLNLHWDESLIEWLLTELGAFVTPREWERVVDERLTPVLAGRLVGGETGDGVSLIVKYENSEVKFDAYQVQKGGQ